MALDDDTIQKIQSYLCTCIDDLVCRKKRTWNEISKPVAGFKPFHSALLSDNMIKMADFERSFSTVLGKIFEGCAKIIAKSRFETIETQKNLTGLIPTNTNAEIERVVAEINKGNVFTDYQDEVKRIVEFVKSDHSKMVEKSVISDLYVKDKYGNEVFFEMKTPKPNKEQCLNIARKHLWIHSMIKQAFPETKTYYAMSYNPYAEISKYKHSFAVKYMDVKNQVLIGKQFWDFLGSEGAYEELLDIFSHVGTEKTAQIEKLLKD